MALPMRASSLRESKWLRLLSTGESRLFDASQLLAYPAFEPLADQGTFESFSIEHGVVSWEAGEIDIAPERMYAISLPYEKVA